MKVAVFTYQGVSLFEAACALELFALEREEITDWYEARPVCLESDSVDTNVFTSLSVSKVDNLNDFDMLVIPSWFTDNRPVSKPVSDAIIAFHDSGKRIISFCSGAFLLAQLGLLNGRTATTHWKYAESFKRYFPSVSFRDDVLYVLEDSIGCSAGSSAAIDLGLEIIRRDHSHDIANLVARRLVLSAHRKGHQAQFADNPLPKTNSAFSSALEWAQAHLNNSISINDIAEKANMSRRNFDRKIRADLNLSATEWLLHQKLMLAKSMLESTRHGIEKIADASGFGSADLMRHHFRKEYGISPREYRQSFAVVD